MPVTLTKSSITNFMVPSRAKALLRPGSRIATGFMVPFLTKLFRQSNSKVKRDFMVPFLIKYSGHPNVGGGVFFLPKLQGHGAPCATFANSPAL